MLRIGQMMIAAVPGEFTTMAGRRLRRALDSESAANGGPTNTKTVIAGLSNVYTHYITTFEEYQVFEILVLTKQHDFIIDCRSNAMKALPQFTDRILCPRILTSTKSWLEALSR